jgi:hypothetical protein
MMPIFDGRDRLSPEQQQPIVAALRRASAGSGNTNE